MANVDNLGVEELGRNPKYYKEHYGLFRYDVRLLVNCVTRIKEFEKQ